MIILTALLILTFLAVTLAVSARLSQRDAAKRRLERLARMRSESAGDSESVDLAVEYKKPVLLSQIPLIARAEERSRQRWRHHSYAAELPQMLEIIALGVRSGLGFDQSFGLYVRRFETPLAELCRQQFDIWERGLIPREQGLKALAEEVNLPLFSRFVSNTLRALNYGAALNKLLLDLAAETRKAYHSERQEIVAKAPVKMLLPTGALILPAMLLLVIGPILLELTGRMG